MENNKQIKEKFDMAPEEEKNMCAAAEQPGAVSLSEDDLDKVAGGVDLEFLK